MTKRNWCEGTYLNKDHPSYRKRHLFPARAKRRFKKHGANDPKVYYQCLICLHTEQKANAMHEIELAKQRLQGKMTARGKLIPNGNEAEIIKVNSETIIWCDEQLKKLDDENYLQT